MHEIEKKDDGLHDFLKEHEARLVVALDGEIMAGTKEVLAEFPHFAGKMRGRNKADPFVIATARTKQIIVVSEAGARGKKSRPRIPLACDHFKVERMTVLDYIEHQDWVFE